MKFMQQLRMIRYAAPVTERAFPEGFSWRRFNGTEKDALAWVEICKNGLLSAPKPGTEDFDANIRRCADCVPEEDCLFAVDADGRPVSTVTVIRHADGSGHVHMVASMPETRGKGLGHAMMTVAMRILEERGVPFTRLRSDDFRLAALKTYLVAGFQPVIFHDPESDMTARWDAILEKLNFGPVEYVQE